MSNIVKGENEARFFGHFCKVQQLSLRHAIPCIGNPFSGTVCPRYKTIFSGNFKIFVLIRDIFLRI
jgi:hypothetical protein